MAEWVDLRGIADMNTRNTKENTKEEIDFVLEKLFEIVEDLRKISS